MLFWENHDRPRAVSYYANDREMRFESATMLATMCYLQKGVPFIYQGQEIGVTNNISDRIEDYEDIEALNFYNENIGSVSHDALMAGLNSESRDHARHPMPWNGNADSGFGSEKPWFGLYNRYKEINVEKDIASEKSVYRYFKELLKVRSESNAVRHGRFEDLTDGRHGCCVYKMSDGSETVFVICNFEHENKIEVDFDGEIILANCKRTEICGVYAPYECAVINGF